MASGSNFMGDHLFGGAPLWLWLVFHALVFGLLTVDWAFTRKAREEPSLIRRSNWLTAVWIAGALLFALVVYRTLSQQYALEYLTAYGIEESLSIDNLFVFLVLFQAFRLKLTQQRRVLFFGVLGAIVMRAAMILAGIGLLNSFSWMNYIFGGILLYTAFHLLRKSIQSQPERPLFWMNWLNRHPPMAREKHPYRFFVREEGHLRFTPLFIALLAIETTDLLFATDSIPAVLAVSHHPFIVYSSNIFAVLGLRSLYFALASVMQRLHKLRYGLVVILIFVGGKMMLANVVTVPIWVSLIVLASAITITAVWSLMSKTASERSSRPAKSV
ncbi:MAG TPA: TerC/Alx family metal homeostasis membrane protein [Acidobacteriaceae bacterium]|nr:TerC/Alx family metal homeostasis membrane protein [Acidobacteriaceae bacterium]